MDAEQAQQLLTRIMDLSSAATTPTQISSNVMKKFEETQESRAKSGKFGDGAKILRSPEVFDVDDPVSLRREQFMNWELSIKLYSILSSYLKGRAPQIVRARSLGRNGFAAWSNLRSSYAPRARPRALAAGQEIMQHPAFPHQKIMQHPVSSPEVYAGKPFAV